MIDFEEVAVENVSRHFGRRQALSRVSFQAGRRRILGLLGPNGAGKSTMLSLLATLMQPASGRIRYGSLEPDVHRAEIRGRIGVLGHDLFLYADLTARENLTFFAGLSAMADPQRATAVALERAGLTDRGDDPVASLSRGMRQRIALERALIHGPRLLLLDEPFTGLDDASAAALVGRLRQLREVDSIVVLATHDLDVADGLLDDAIFLRDGRVAEAVARPEGLRAMYRDVIGRAGGAPVRGD